MDYATGSVTGVNGNLVSVHVDGSIRKNEVGYVLVGDTKLKGEVIRIANGVASMQIYEVTSGIQVGRVPSGHHRLRRQGGIHR